MATVTIKGKNITLNLPDDMSDEEIAAYVDFKYPRTGQDVEDNIKYNLLDYDPSLEDFRKYKSFSQERGFDASDALKGVGRGLLEMGKSMIGLPAAALADPTAIPASAAEAVAQNLLSYGQILSGGTDPGGMVFNAVNGSDETLAYFAWRDNLNRAKALAKAATGQETLTGFQVNPEQVQGLSPIADPMNLVGVGMVGKAGTAGAKATQAVGAALRSTGRAAESIAAVPKNTIAAVARNVAGITPEAATQLAERTATAATVADLAGGLVPGAAEAATVGAAGTAAKAIGEATEAVGRAMVGGEGQLSALERALLDPTISTAAKVPLTIAQRVIPREAAGVALQAAKAGLSAGAINGILEAAQTTDADRIGEAVGGGLAAGGIMGATARMIDVSTGKVSKERALNEAGRQLRAFELMGEAPEELALRAEFIDKLSNMDRDGKSLATFVAMTDLAMERNRQVKVVDGKKHLIDGKVLEGWNAVFDKKDGTIYINGDNAEASTLPHEMVHSLVTDVVADEITNTLFRRDSEGKLTPQLNNTEVAKLLDDYIARAENITYPDGTTQADKIREEITRITDPTVPTDQVVRGLRDITHEIAATYAEDWVKGKDPRSFIRGAVPTIWEEGINVAKTKLRRLFNSEVKGNPILDPIMDRIFAKDVPGIPQEPVSVKMTPDMFRADYADRLGVMMNDKIRKQHFPQVFDQIKDALIQNGAKESLSKYYSRNGLSVLDLPDNVIWDLTKRTITTKAKANAPLLYPIEAQNLVTMKQAIREGKVARLSQVFKMMSESGVAETGNIRMGTPFDKDLVGIDIIWNRDGGVQLLAFDYGNAIDRLGKAVASGQSGFADMAQARRYMDAYLEYLSKNRFTPEAAKNSRVAVEVDGVPLGDQRHASLLKSFQIPTPSKRFAEQGVTMLNKLSLEDAAMIGRMGAERQNGMELIPLRRVVGSINITDIRVPLDVTSIQGIQRHFQPTRTKYEQLPNGSVAQDVSGDRIVKTDTTGYRVFDVLGNRVGIFKTFDQAAEASTRRSIKDTQTINKLQDAIQEQRAKEVSVRQRASYREAIRQGDTQGQEAARARFQPQKDEAYLKAVEQGDTARAQELADEAARAAGYKTVFAFHGTPVKKDINVFDVSGKGKASGAGLFLSSSEDVAKTYAGKSGKVYKVYLKLDAPVEIDAKGGWWGNLSDAVILHEGKDTKLDVKSIFGHVNSYTDAIGRKLDKSGWDSAIIRNVSDVGTKKTQGKSKLKPSDVFIVKDPSQLKSADPITYDNNGNIIPLSKRFDVASQDIRFQPKRKKEKPLPRTPFEMGEQIAKREKGMAESAQRRTDRDVAALRAKFEAEGTATAAEAAILQEQAIAQQQELSRLFSKDVRKPLTEQEYQALQETNKLRDYVEALIDFENTLGGKSAGVIYKEQPLKMTSLQKDAILRKALSKDTPEAMRAIQVAREFVPDEMRVAIERMFSATERGAVAQEQLGQQQAQARQSQARPYEQMPTPQYGANPQRALTEWVAEMVKTKKPIYQADKPLGPGVGDLIRARKAERASKAAEKAKAEAVEAEKKALEEKEYQEWKRSITERASRKFGRAEEVVASQEEPIRKDRVILKINGKYRLYGASAGLIGVFRSKEDAIKKAKK